MATLADKGTVIQITIGTQIRNIHKLQIAEISLVKQNILKIDCNMGAMGSIYVPYADVTQPQTASPGELRDLISSYLGISNGGAVALPSGLAH